MDSKRYTYLFYGDMLIIDLLSREHPTDHVNSADLAQPVCCALQIGLVNLFSYWGILPDSVIGHSSGEIAAAYAAGALSAEDTIRVAYHRGRVLSKVTKKGGMAVVSLGREGVTPYLVDGVGIACKNSPQSVTLSGDQDALGDVTEKIKEDDPDLLCRMLRVDKAYHSAHMLDVGDEYEAALEGISPKITSLAIPFFSTVTGKRITEGSELNARYWRQNLESPVLFTTGTQAMLTETPRVFVEIGPHSALSGPLRQIFSDSPHGEVCSYIPSLVRGENPTTSVLVTAGNMYNAGLPISLRPINGQRSLLVDLPPYPWQHDTRYWSQTPAVEAWRQRKYPHHELLGSRVLGSTDLEPSWRNTLALDDAPWLYGHRVMSKTLFPGAGYVAMAGEAIQQVMGSSNASYQISHLLLKYALFIDSNETVELVTNLKQARISDIQDSDWWEFSITSVQAGETIRVCTGQVRLASSTMSLSMPLTETKNLKRRVAPGTWYKALREIGIDYNREFRGLDGVHADPVRHEAAATVKTAKVSPCRYVTHPTTIDRCLQLLSVAMFRGLARNINIRSLPVMFEDIFVGPEAEELDVQALADPGKGSFIMGDLGASSDENVVLSIKGARLHVLGDEGEQESELAARPTWMPHIDFLSPKALAKPPPPLTPVVELRERLADIYIAETATRARDVEPKDDHLHKYKRWLQLGQARIQKQSVWRLSDFGIAHDCPYHSGQTMEMTNWLRERADVLVSLGPLAACMHRVLENTSSVIEGACNPLHLLMEDDGLKNVYDGLLSFDSCNHFFSTLGHSNPEIRILEVGAGTGSATERFLNYLHAPDGSRMYAQYVFTDVSAGFLAAAKERFSRYDGMEYAVLNISEEPASQGFQGHFDLIIASNVCFIQLEELANWPGRPRYTESQPVVD